MSRDRPSRREFCQSSVKAAAAGVLAGSALGAPDTLAAGKKRRRPRVKLVITVEKVKGRCPVYKRGDRIVLENGYRFNLGETTAACMHSLASILPYHVAIAKGVPPNRMGLAHKEKKDGKAYVQCLDPCDETGGGTAIFSIERVEE